jgi:hypothetical protein
MKIMKKIYILTGILIASFLMLCNIFVNAQNNRECALFEGFENMSQNAAYLGRVVNTPNGDWWIVGYSTMDTNDRRFDTKSIRLRANNSDTALIINGNNTRGANVIEMQFDMTNGIGDVSFYYGSYSTHSGGKVFVEYSTDSGVTWLEPDNNFVTAPTWASAGKVMLPFTVSINVSGNIRMRIIKYKQTGTTNSVNIDNICVTSYGGTPNTVATPTFSPSGGNYLTTQNVTINCATEGATIRYTTNGSEPTETSTQFTTPINISSTTTLKAKAWKPVLDPSSIATAIYTFPIEVPNIAAFKATTTVTNPTIYKITGDVVFVYRGGPNNRNIYIKDNTGGLMIFDNTTPKIITTEYQNGDIISGGIIGSCTVYSGLYELIPSINTAPGIPGTPVAPTKITMSNLLANFAEYESQLLCIENVTFDEGTFTGSGAGMNINMYQEGDVMACRNYFVNLTGYTTIPDKLFHVIGFPVPFNTEKQFAPRDANDIIAADQIVATPDFSPAGGNYDAPVTVSITTATENAKIYYTTDGSEPTETSTLYTEPFTISGTTTVKARGFHSDLNPSIIVSATYQFPNPDQVATPTFTPAGGAYNTDVFVNILCATPDAAIYYTLNGNEPTETDILFENPIEMPSGTTVLKAKAYKTGLEPSEVTTATYFLYIGVEEWGAQITIFPNPTTGELRIMNYELRITNIEIYDIYGRNLTPHTAYHTPQTVINVAHFPAGIYFVKIKTEAGEMVKKVVKK